MHVNIIIFLPDNTFIRLGFVERVSVTIILGICVLVVFVVVENALGVFVVVDKVTSEMIVLVRYV